jgi:hypothetical protein
MRHWLFHPLIFYPLVIVLGLLVVAVSLRPQAWPRDPAPAAAEIAGSALVYQGEAFATPNPAPEQVLTVVRDFWGRPHAMRVAVLANQPEPTPAEQGVRIMMTPEDAARVSDRPVIVEVSYNPLPVTTAHGLAVSLQGIGPADWVTQPVAPQQATLRFELPAQMAVNAIGFRVISQAADYSYGVEITRVRVIPRA